MSVAHVSDAPAEAVLPVTSTDHQIEGGSAKDELSMRELFEQGTKIATHRKENVFQELDKRTLSEEEELVIKMRVEHQRKMYALFEKQERNRKIEELKELCGGGEFGLTDEEAGRALDLCGGDEQQAGAALTGELGAAFRRRCMEPERIAEMREEKKRERAAAKKSASKIAGKWHAMPDPKMRGKPVDRSQLEGHIFVGAFRGKGFQGNGRSGKMVLRKLTEKEMGMDNEDKEEGKENAEEQNVEVAEGGEAGEAREDEKESAGTPQASKEPLSRSQEDNMAAKSVSPKANKKKAKAKSASPKSTAKAATMCSTRGKKRMSTDGDAVPRDSSAKTAKSSPEPAQKEGDETVQEASPSPTRKSVRQKKSRTSTIDPSSKTDEYLARINATESNSEAAAFLRSLGSDKLVSHLLQVIGANDPMRAIELRQAVDEDEENSDQAVVATEPTSEQGAATSVPEPMQVEREPSPKKKVPQNESECTVSVQIVEDTAGAAAPALTPVSKQKAQPPQKNIQKTQKAYNASVISAKGHTHRGRVKQKSHKSAELIEAGSLRLEKGWFNAGYIFPEGFKSRTLFRSSVALDSLCVHECDVIGKGGQFWPAPTFRVVALDRPDEPLIAKSCTGCWTGILKRINAEIEARRQAGEDLPPPPKTAIAGPEYFGFNQADIQEAVEALDPNHEVEQYWNGKVERNRARKGLPAEPKAKMVRRTTTAVSDKVNKVTASATGTTGATGTTFATGSGTGIGRRGRRPAARTTSSGHEIEEEEEGDEANFVASRWSAVSRTERYRNRLQEAGDEEAAAKVDSENPIPDFMDPITLEPVIAPAISPYGHVMGSATWRAVLGASGVCPFTKKPLRWEQCKVLTKNNYDAYKDSIIQ